MSDDDLRNWTIILTPPGADWSGRARYAAAMHFHKKGQMDAAVLEIYRTCARLDDEDPLDALRQYHMGETWIARAMVMKARLDESGPP